MLQEKKMVERKTWICKYQMCFSLQFKAAELEMSCEMSQTEEDEAQFRNDNEVFNHRTEGEEENAEGNSNDKSEELTGTKPRNTCKKHLGEETKTEKEEQRGKKKNTCPPVCNLHWENQCVSMAAYKTDHFYWLHVICLIHLNTLGKSALMTYVQYTNNTKVSFSRLRYMDVYDDMFDFFIFFFPSKATECQKPDETPSDDLTGFKEEQGEDTGPEELKGDEEHKRRTDDEETTQMGHGAEDEGQMREDRKEERLQAGGEEGDEEHVETDTSINNHTTLSEVKRREDEDVQENEDSNTQENSKSEELNEAGVEDASVSVGEQLRDSSEQHLDKETKSEKEEQRGKKKNVHPSFCNKRISVCLWQL